MRSVGIDIGSSSVKMVEVVQSNRGVSIQRFFEKTLNPQPGSDNEIQILETLKDIASQYDPDSTRFTACIRQDKVSVRHKLFPFNDRSKILKSLPFELEEDLPFSSENSAYDARIIKNIGNSAELLACATPKTKIEEAIHRFSSCGIDLHVLSAESLALSNCWEKWQEGTLSLSQSAEASLESESNIRNISITLQLGHTHTLACAFEGDRMIGTRSISWGAKSIAESISRKYEIEYIQALKEAQGKSFVLTNREEASHDQTVFSDTITSALSDLIRHIKISMLEFQSEFNCIITSVELTGGGSRIINLAPYLTTQLGTPVRVASILDRFASSNIEKTAHVESVIGLPLGLALEGLRKPRNPALNFLKGEFAVKNKKIEKFWQTWGHTAQILSIAFFCFCVYSFLRDDIALGLIEKSEEAVKIQAKDFARLPKKMTNESGVKKHIRELKKKSSEIKSIENLSRMNSALDLVQKISGSLPPRSSINLNISRIDIKEQKVEIEGYVVYPQEISIIQNSLNSVSIAGSLRTAQPRLPVPKDRKAFAFSFNMDRELSTPSSVSKQ